MCLFLIPIFFISAHFAELIFISSQIGAPKAWRWEIKINRAEPAWSSVKPYSKNFSGDVTELAVNLAHVSKNESWSPDCENENNTNKFEFAVRVSVMDEEGQGWKFMSCSLSHELCQQAS